MIAALGLGIISQAAAQDEKKHQPGSTPERRAEAITARMNERLHLSADQRSKVYALNLEQTRSQQLIRDGKLNKEKARELRVKNRGRLQSVLTADQKKIWKESRKTHGKHDGRKPQRPDQAGNRGGKVR